MASKVKAELEVDTLSVVADRGYYNSAELRSCEQAGIDVDVPNSATSPNKAKGQFDKRDFIYAAEADEYECPAGQRLTRRTRTNQNGLVIYRYWSSACQACPLKSQCTTGKERRVSRWEHEDVLERARARLDRHPDAMRTRRATV